MSVTKQSVSKFSLIVCVLLFMFSIISPMYSSIEILSQKESEFSTSEPGNFTNVNHIDVGPNNACAIIYNGSLYCWGEDNLGQLGDGGTLYSGNYSSTPVEVSLPNGRTAISVGAGEHHTCAVLDNASVYCWGYGVWGLLGNGATSSSSTPVAVSLPSGRMGSMVSVGWTHSCAILDDGSIYCWGNNGNGQFGDGTTSGSSTPVAVILPGGQTAVSVDTEHGHTCAILDNASLYCWGDNGYGQLGDGSTTDQHTPVAVSLPSGRTAVSVTTGGSQTCVILDDASLYCWGSNGYGQLGDGSNTDRSTPVAVILPSDRTVSSVNAGEYHTCAVLDDASLYCWGSNGYNELGDGTTTNRNTPGVVSLPSGRSVFSVSAGKQSTCAALDNGSVMCWGVNSRGQLGDGSITDRSTPIYVNLPTVSTVTFDTDLDGIPDIIDLDDDNDGWSDITEIDCGDSDPLNETSTPADYDEDGICNTLDEDDDNDSFPDSNDDFPLDECAVFDTDGDGMPDWIFLNCNTNLSEDFDDDNDGYNDTNDSHPQDPSEWFDTDNDGIGNNQDTDDDGDNVPDQFDAFPLDSTEWMDTDGDGVGDNADTDNDDDGVLDTNDDFPNDANETTDTDGDGIGNNADDDDDGDGYLDIYDQFPLDSTEWIDTDLDGIGNNADPDDDGDGWTDNDEFICGSDELDANDVPDDSDGDGICDSEEDDITGLAIIVDVISNPLVVVLFLLMGMTIIITLFLQSRNQSSRINKLEGMLGNKTIIEDDGFIDD